MTAPVGIVLAAGRSRRMGAPKQMLPWPGAAAEGSLVASSFDAIAEWCSSMIVTIGANAPQVRSALAPRVFTEVECDSEGPMFASLRRALRRALEIGCAAGVLVMPADCPGVGRPTVRRVLAEASNTPSAFIAPSYRGRAGHPLLIPHSLVPMALAHDGTEGLRGLWRDRPELRVTVDVDDAACIHDIDTPQDYRALTEQ